jgi:predicted nucleotidyltransferase
MTPPIEPAHRTILTAFERHGAEFVLVGGVALQLHGWTGATADVDLTVATDAGNVERVNRALAELGASEPMVGALGTAFETRHGRVELVRVASGVGTFDDWARRAVTVDVGGLSVRVGHPEDLIRSKEAAGRPKDLDTLPLIRRDLAVAGRLSGDGRVVASSERDTPAYLREAIGERPRARRARRLWDNAAARIEEYRERWGITDPSRGLGPDPVNEAEANERRVMERLLQRTVRMIARTVEPQGTSVDP